MPTYRLHDATGDDRDTVEQVRIAAAELGAELQRRLAAPWTSPKRGE